MNSELAAKVSFRLSKLLAIISPELVRFEDSRKKLFEKYGEVDGEQMRIPAAKEQEFLSEWTALLAETVEFSQIQFTLEDLGDVKLTAIEMRAFTPWIKEEVTA